MNKNIEVPHFYKQILGQGYVQYVDHMGSEADIISAARLSTDGGFVSWDPYKRCKDCKLVWLQSEEKPASACSEFYDHNWQNFPRGDSGLLEYLFKNHHNSPFEMCELVVEIQCPMSVRSQIHRHRTFSYNEFSARYAEMPEEFYVPEIGNLKVQSTMNKQGSAGQLDIAVAEEVQGILNASQELSNRDYQHLIELGLARETARFVLPNGQFTKFRMKGNLRNFLHFLHLRKPSNAQPETRAVADAVGTIVEHHFPRTYALFEEYTLYAKTLSRTEYAEYQKWLAEQKTQGK